MSKILLTTVEHVILGGGITFFYRLSQYAKSANVKAMVLTNYKYDIDDNARELLNKGNIKVVRYKYKGGCLTSVDNIEMYIHDGDEVISIQDTSDFAFLIVKMFNSISKRICVSTVFYPLFWGNVASNSMIWKMFHTPLIRELFERDCVYYMDQVIMEIASNYNNLPQSTERIVNIGMNPCSGEVKKISLKNDITILGVSRLDFPYKGFMVGLIRRFPAYLKKHPNSRLIMIGSGPGEQKLKEEYEKLELSVKSRVTLTGELPYEEYMKLMKQISIVVGMGTALLEYAKVGIPCITASAYQYDTYSSGFLGDRDTECLGGPISGLFSKYVNDVTKYNRFQIYDLIEKCIDMTESELNLLQIDHVNIYKKYSVENAFNRLINIKNIVNYESLPTFIKARVFMYAFMKLIRDVL